MGQMKYVYGLKIMYNCKHCEPDAVDGVLNLEAFISNLHVHDIHQLIYRLVNLRPCR